MGSCSEPRNKGIDTTAGALVWVRRRNGSWWPGLVMPLEGLPRRRKGTPVKLLGKEDGSMDWYDLEKSKRIKAFRCGEYDECIRKAKASAQCSHKADRMGKYARREDAIIHALELERVHDSNGNWEFYSDLIQLISQKGKQGPPKEKASTKKNATKVKDESPQSVNSSEYHKATISDKVQTAKKRKWRTLSDNLDGVKDVTRMRGDLGVKCGRASAITGGVRCCDLDLVDDLSITDTNFNSTFLRSRSPLHHMKDIYSTKRGQRETHLNEVSKRKNRRRPITKVLESTSRVILPSFNSQEGSPGPTGQSPLLEAVQNKFNNFDSSESKKTEFSVVINNSSEYSENSCADVSGVLEVTKDVVIDQTCFSYSNELSSAFVAVADGFFDDLFDVPVLSEENYNGDYYHAISSPTSKDVCRVMVGSDATHIEAAGTSLERNLGAANVGDERQKGKKGNSRQHLKGKNLTRVTGPNEEAFDTADISKSLLSACDVASSSRIEDKIEEISWSRLLELNDSIQLMSCGLFPSKRSHQSLKHIHEIPDVASTYPIRSCKTKELVDCSDTSQYGPGERNRANDLYKDSSSLKFLDESLAEDMTPHQNLNAVSMVPGSSILYDVKVGLQETDKDAHVPCVYLRNKAIGKAIFGHPIPVQIVESDYLDSLMPSRSFCVAIDVSDKHSRTSMLEEPINNAAASFLLDNKKEYKVRGNSKSHRKYKKRDPDYHRMPSASRMKTSQVKRPKVLPRKIRKLSSITVDRGTKDALGENMVGKLVACVPAKLVFRRITEALGCLPQQDGRA